MIFNSIEFLIFLPIVLLLYWALGSKNIRAQNVLILAASYLFYGWWDWRFLSLIFVSTVIDYFSGRNIYAAQNKKNKKYWLWLSIGVNLGILGFFKYFNFFVDSFIVAFDSVGISLNRPSLTIILPVGISFYTFQTLSYTIDIYKDRLTPTNNFLNFAAFVSFFPQLVAGPIERARNLLPQFSNPRIIDYRQFSDGIKWMIYGFFLKLVLADRAGIYVDSVYNFPKAHDGITFVAATLLFTFQIYGDFAGYSLIAIGTAKLLGFDLMTNFRRPFFAKSVNEFWQRWHISLSTWFRDYVYIPLGGNRNKKPRYLMNLMITFTVSGFWHGAGWTYIIWGALNGIYVVAEVLLFNNKLSRNLLNILITFVLINFAFVVFRSNTVADLYLILEKIFTKPGKLFFGFGADVVTPIYAGIAILILLLIEIRREYFPEQFSLSYHQSHAVRLLYYAGLVVLILYIGVFGESQFIYFQF